MSVDVYSVVGIPQRQALVAAAGHCALTLTDHRYLCTPLFNGSPLNENRALTIGYRPQAIHQPTNLLSVFQSSITLIKMASVSPKAMR